MEMNPEYKVGMNDVAFFNKETGEEIKSTQSISTLVLPEQDGYVGIFKPVSVGPVGLNNEWVHPDFLAYLIGCQNEPHIKKLIASRNKTKSKRIKKKMNKKITTILQNELRQQ